eukprot:TRINITY_DN6471_c0_g1_i2.p1 TRINITY_DN6471_c0_g1~~TRINITY_DN6471_c0_g1_i2.p1  ORF type:complete len:186 (-),score=38.77 TRINITY_DN6471_c0_g1_i2:73-630(-)
MISSFPYPPQFLDWMRALFANPTPFINDCLEQIKKEGFTGYNVDFEPTVTATAKDATDYVHFLNTFADALHGIHKKLSVDIAGWNPLWDWGLLSKSRVDKLMIMSTYTGDFATFKTNLLKATESFHRTHYAIGLESSNDVTKKNYTNAELAERFDLLKLHNIEDIHIWDMPIPENFWPFVNDFVH